jgi:hypothetical protein
MSYCQVKKVLLTLFVLSSVAKTNHSFLQAAKKVVSCHAHFYIRFSGKVIIV